MRSILIWSLLILLSVTQNRNARSANENGNIQSETPNAKAMIIVYRYKQFTGFPSIEPPVYVDDIEQARMDNGRFFKICLNPGEHTFRSSDKQSGVKMDFKAGQTYYTRVDIVTGFKRSGRVVLMPPEQGSYEIEKLKPLGIKKVKDRSKVIVDNSSCK